MESYRQEFAEFTKGGEYRFSLRHRLKMRKVFQKYDNSKTIDLSISSKPTLRRRLMVALIVALTAVILTITVIGIITNGFRFVEHEDHTQFDAADIIDYPTTIEEIYEPTWIPEGFKVIEIEELKAVREVKYVYNNDHFMICQLTKPTFIGYADSQKYYAENIDVNGCTATYWKSEGINKIFWDNGQYIISISGTITKEELIKLAKSTKLKIVE